MFSINHAISTLSLRSIQVNLNKEEYFAQINNQTIEVIFELEVFGIEWEKLSNWTSQELPAYFVR